MAHPNSRLSVFGRQLLVSRVAQGWSAAEVRHQPCHRPQGLRRYPAGGQALLDQRSCPHRSPRRLADDRVTVILRARPGAAMDRTAWRR